MADEIDPTRSTNPAFDRRTFVGISAVAAVGLAVGGRATAAGLGTTHPPLVAENDPAIQIQHLTLLRPDIELPAYAAWPKRATVTTPAIVVTMHIWGVDTSIRDVVRRYARLGYIAIAPDLYARGNEPPGDGVSDISVFRPFAKALAPAQVAGDLRAAALWCQVARPQAKIGITGFCMGGTLVLQQTIANADIFAAAAPFYGAVKDIDPAKVGVPICGSYGGRDTSIPSEGVLAFGHALTVPHDIKIYPEAGHAFFDDQRAAYVASAAEDAWVRTVGFFRKYVGAPA
ncbi:MAG: dienelactone hydrolase family protein [Candidatus Eremiobacteraeota bacterium]|nr:dienelactone hydrolase family protein [Candidatus Eremiobacteraeota bacterium]